MPWWLLAFLAAILGLVLAYGLSPGKASATLYFPAKEGTVLVAEQRNVPFSGSLEDRARSLLRELLLGPQARSSSPLFQGEVSLSSILERGGRLHVGLRIDRIQDQRLDIGQVKKAISQSLERSLPGVPGLELYVNGVHVSRAP